MNKSTNDYDDIINLSHHQSTTRPQMSLHDRAAQFSPFAALTGYDEVLSETARQTEKKLELATDGLETLLARLNLLEKMLMEQPEVTVKYFLPDKKKTGGKHVTVTGRAKKIDEYKQRLVMGDGTTIPLDEIVAISGEIFNCLE